MDCCNLSFEPNIDILLLLVDAVCCCCWFLTNIEFELNKTGFNLPLCGLYVNGLARLAFISYDFRRENELGPWDIDVFAAFDVCLTRGLDGRVFSLTALFWRFWRTSFAFNGVLYWVVNFARGGVSGVCGVLSTILIFGFY